LTRNIGLTVRSGGRCRILNGTDVSLTEIGFRAAVIGNL
jgi:hypothetical protein